MAQNRLGVISLLAVIVTAGTSPTVANAQDRDRVTNFPEQFSIQPNNRLRMVYFDDGQDEACPAWTSLIYGAGERFDIVVPTFALLGLRGSTTAGAAGGREAYSKDLAFWNEQCKYRISIKKIVVKNGTEVEVPLYKDDRQWLEELKRRDPVVPELPPHPRRNKIVEYPDRSGFNQFHIVFESLDSKTEFSGLFYIAPKSMTVYLVNAAKDVHLASRKNHSKKSYEVDIKSSEATIRLSVTKELYRNDSWTKAFSE